VVEPHVEGLPPDLAALSHVRLSAPDGAIAAADILLLLVDHRQFRSIDRTGFAEKVVVDTRGVWR
jgi:UDP-N-acetyl-D-mannosaminuronic acid dehydrogenase